MPGSRTSYFFMVFGLFALSFYSAPSAVFAQEAIAEDPMIPMPLEEISLDAPPQPTPADGEIVPEFSENAVPVENAVPLEGSIEPLLPEAQMPPSEQMPPPELMGAESDSQPIPVEPTDAATPEQAGLAPPVEAGSENAANPAAIPDAQAEAEFDEDLFFDAESLVPNSELSRKGGPSKVNPSLQPGSRLIVTRSTHDANSKDARMVAAERALKLGRYESALEIYTALYDVNQRDPNVLMGRAVALQRIGRDDEAIRAYEQLLDIRPENTEAQINLYGLMSKHYPAVALQNLRGLYENNPGNTALIAQIAVVEAQAGRYEDAIRYLGTAASMEPKNAGHLYNMAVIADRAGDKEKALQYYEEALEVDTLYGASRSIPRESVFERLAQLR